MTPVAEAKSAESESPEAPAITRSPEEEAALAANDSSDLTQEQASSATDYFLSEEAEPPTALRFQVNVASVGQPDRWIWWTVRSLSREEIKEVRAKAVDSNTGVEDDMAVNLQLVLKASIEPDFSDPKIRGKYADPADALLKRFRHKPGLIEAIARKCNEMSGYGPQANVVRLVDAAGN